MGSGVLPDRQHHRSARLWTPGRLVWSAPHDPHGVGVVRRRIRGLRVRSHYNALDGGARAAGIWRRRTHELVTGARRRDHSAARARPLSGLPRWSIGRFQYIRTDRRRLSHASVRLALNFSRQRPARPRRGFTGGAAQSAAGRRTAHQIRCAGAGVVHVVREPGHLGSRTGPAYGHARIAGDPGLAGFRRGRAVGADMAGEAL